MLPSNLQSSKPQNLQPHFIEFLSSLGRPFDNTSDSMVPQRANYGQTIACVQDMRRALYWEDASSEIMFYVPSLGKQDTPHPEGNVIDQDEAINSRYGPGNQQATSSNRHNLARQYSSGAGCGIGTTDNRILIVWLESYEDHHSFPSEQIVSGIASAAQQVSNPTVQLHSTENLQSSMPSKEILLKDTLTIFIHELKSGLLRINVKGYGNRLTVSSPLVDGMIVSRRALGPLVRQTSLNVASRKRLEQENYQPSHVRRKNKIQELAHKYRCPLSTADFYANLL